MGFFTRLFGKKKQQASANASSTSTPKAITPNIKCQTGDSGNTSSPNSVHGATVEQAKEDALYPFAQWTLKNPSDAQVRRSDSKQSSRLPKLSELFGRNDTEFLGDATISAPTVFKKPSTSVPKQSQTGENQHSNNEVHDGDAHLEKDSTKLGRNPVSDDNTDSAAYIQTVSPKDSVSEPSMSPASQCYTSDLPDDQSDDGYDSGKQSPVNSETSEYDEVIARPSHLYKSISGTDWADDDDDWKPSVSGHPNEIYQGSMEGDEQVYYTSEEDDQDLEDMSEEEIPLADQDLVEEETTAPTSSLYQSKTGNNWADYEDEEDHWDVSVLAYEANTYAVEQHLADEVEVTSLYKSGQSHRMETSPTTSDSSETDRFDAGYEGTSRSLAARPRPRNLSQWGWPSAERYIEIEEDHNLLFRQLYQESALDIAALKAIEEYATINPEGEDTHDREIRKVFVDLYPGLPSAADTSKMHIIDWKTLLDPDWDIEGQFILHFVHPRLCDVVATLLFESHPSVLDAFLDKTNTIVEWWYRPHYSTRGTFNIVIRRNGDEVTIGIFRDHVFSVCWSRFIRVKITPDRRWNEYFAFNGTAISSRESGEINWSQEAFQSVDTSSETPEGTAMRCWIPNEAFRQGRFLALHLLRQVLDKNRWTRYRHVTDIHYVVDGKKTVLEKRSVCRVHRQSGTGHERASEMAQSEVSGESS